MTSIFAPSSRRFALAVVATALLSTFAHAPRATEPMPMRTAAAAAAPMKQGAMDMKAMMKDMSSKMDSMPMSGNPDVDFATMMKVHHQGAIDMAKAELSNGKDAQMKKMAKNIIDAQKKEIAQFDAYLRKHGHSGEGTGK